MTVFEYCAIRFTRSALILACLLAAGGCFYGSHLTGQEAQRLQKQSADSVDQVLGLGRYDKPARTLPNGVEEENPWVLDPVETVKKPENRKLMKQSEAEFAAAKARQTMSTGLRTAGYALAGLAVLLLALQVARELVKTQTPVSPEPKSPEKEGETDAAGESPPQNCS